MGNVLYRKYRSRSLEEIVGQPHITKTLDNALKKGRIAHAYLFTGPRGVGKTSIARILAREANGLSYEQAEDHLDIIEIDAASNRRIDEIRELRDKVHNAPTQASYKVYIIDEVHMLTKEAFNALLKTLEEPPAHVIFILATTEAHKLPETIVSRTQKFTFRTVPAEAVADHLKQIAKKESISISDEALQLIAQHGQGSFRDSIGVLDQVRYIVEEGGTIQADDITATIGIVSSTAVDTLLKAVTDGTIQDILHEVERINESGVSAARVAQQLAGSLRQMIVDANQATPEQITLLKELSEVTTSIDPRIALEVTLLSYASVRHNPTETQPLQHKPRPDTDKSEPSQAVAEPKPKTIAKAKDQTKTAAPEKSTESKAEQSDAANTNTQKTITSGDPAEIWQQVLEALKGAHNTLYGMARMALPHIEENDFVLECKYAFHRKRLNDERHKKILSDAVKQASGSAYVIRCELAEKSPSPSNDRPAPKKSDESVEAINNIFGGSEVLES